MVCQGRPEWHCLRFYYYRTYTESVLKPKHTQLTWLIHERLFTVKFRLSLSSRTRIKNKSYLYICPLWILLFLKISDTKIRTMTETIETRVLYLECLTGRRVFSLSSSITPLPHRRVWNRWEGFPLRSRRGGGERKSLTTVRENRTSRKAKKDGKTEKRKREYKIKVQRQRLRRKHRRGKGFGRERRSFGWTC